MQRAVLRKPHLVASACLEDPHLSTEQYGILILIQRPNLKPRRCKLRIHEKLVCLW